MKNMPVTKTVFQKAFYIGVLAAFGVLVAFSAISFDANHSVVARVAHAETVSNDTSDTASVVISHEDKDSHEEISSPVDNSNQHSDPDKDKKDEKKDKDSDHSHDGENGGGHDGDHNEDDNHCYGDDSRNADSPTSKCGGSHKLSVTLTANPQIIHLGDSSTLTWDSKNTKYCSANWTTSVAVSGTQTVSPTETKTYYVTCTGNPGDSVTTSVTVTVIKDGGQCTAPVFTSALTASGKVGVAFSYTLSATSTGSSTSITYKVGTSTLPAGLSFVPNTISGVPTVSGVFNVPLRATNQCGVAEKTLVLTVSPADNGGNSPTAILTATPTTITAGATSTLSWISSNTTSCYAPWTSATSTTGSFVVSPATTTAYTIICSNATQSATSTATVTVTTDNGGGGGNAPTVTLSALPTSIFAGATSTLSWVSTNATACVAPWTPATSTAGSFVVSPATTTVYSIVCSNGSQSATSTTTVTVTTDNGGGGGNGPAVTLTANPTTVTAGQGSTLSWTSTNTTSCVAPWTTATSTSGSELVSPTATTDYTIACSNGSQSATTTATVTVSTGNGGGSGGGGGGSSGGGGGRSGSRHYVTGGVPAILGAATSCSYLEDYLHIDWTNSPKEVIKLQVFLSALEGFKNLKISFTFFFVRIYT